MPTKSKKKKKSHMKQDGPKSRYAVKKVPKKQVTVSRKWLMDFANSIYNPSTKKYTRLCTGEMQQTECDEDGNEIKLKNPMHCGLGELYFAMTGREPELDHVSEDDVVQLAIDKSTFEIKDADEYIENARAEALNAIQKLNLPSELKDSMESAVDNFNKYTREEPIPVEGFREALDNIPNVNDDWCGSHDCIADVFRNRAKRVAAELRLAAGYLPA